MVRLGGVPISRRQKADIFWENTANGEAKMGVVRADTSHRPGTNLPVLAICLNLKALSARRATHSLLRRSKSAGLGPVPFNAINYGAELSRTIEKWSTEGRTETGLPKLDRSWDRPKTNQGVQDRR